ncbi:hypothetical protein CLROS_010170 [Clostridium felsineum]|uniref:Uncharacterized protein n=1 Tax=Clostridium felsineum TaxID=36839 RepID=A0A1S8MFG8_9CLOT|nr:hypothetical protein CLAUR_014620 [Clostridium felsineum]URZ05691.1 hypothetical protein CLROS_010170 [Clostridium felsineum]URZ10730.1 hypothetical protein CROST_014400 [Clostridium felsineum]URZ17360.1 hypothetical protein CLFE_034130 [Clostridium felsineum DSM 794]
MDNIRKGNTTKNYYWFSLGYYYFSSVSFFVYKKIINFPSNEFYNLRGAQV